ncbi:MAG: hypothetical protein K2W96_18920 [Gemmataceae bacterium]|nr:hypothetical protein [Gemmataceae bacterium]
MRPVVVFVLLSLPASSVGAPDPKAAERADQQKAVERVKELGGHIYHDYQRVPTPKPNTFDPALRPEDPKAFHRVILVHLWDTKATDEDLKLIGKLPHLEILDLTGTQVTSAGLAHLGKLKKLRVLSLMRTKVDDAGLAHVKRHADLWLLFLGKTAVTDAGLVHLKHLAKLEDWLDLSDTAVTDEGLKHLSGLKNLGALNLMRTKVTAEGKRKLKPFLPKTSIEIGR